MMSIRITDDESGTSLEASYDTAALLCDALIQNMPNLGRYIRSVGFEQAVRDLAVTATEASK